MSAVDTNGGVSVWGARLIHLANFLSRVHEPGPSAYAGSAS